MKIILKTVTPMFLGGADGRTPELRAPSIKGMMRFWWRAMNGHSSIEELRKEESKLFGSSDEKVGRSKFSLFIRTPVMVDNEFIIDDAYPLPHHTGNKSCEYLEKTPSCKKNDKCYKGFPSKAIAPDKTFECIIRANGEYIAQVQDIIKVSLILGGLGKRSRRGFGSVEITQIDGNPATQYNSIDELCKLLDLIKPDTFVLNKTKIERIRPVHAEAAYPYIKEIEIGKTTTTSWKDMVKKIGVASHTFDCYHTGFVEKVGGESYRFASPVYVSVIKDKNDKYLPIITTLNCAFDGGFDKLSSTAKKTDNTQKFKDEILS